MEPLRKILGVWLLGLWPPLLGAQLPESGAELFGVTFTSRQLIRINPASGEGSLVAGLDYSGSPMDLAANGQDLFLFYLPGQLRRLNPFTGVTVEVMRVDPMIPGGEGAMDFRVDGTGFLSWSQDSGGTLASVDPERTDIDRISEEGGLLPSMDGLAFDGNGVLYGLSQGTAPSLYKVDPVSGQAELIGALGVSLAAATVGGLAFDSSGGLYAALGNTSISKLYRVNPVSGQAVEVGPIGFARVSGLRFFLAAPGPLGIGRAGAQLRLFWPHTQGGRLVSSPTLSPPWLDVSTMVRTNGPSAEVMIDPELEQSWFRLVR